jgi:DNA helicase INO80
VEQIEVRKKEEKEAAEALKRDQELREARRQQQRLNFLLTQTELYSHFMQNKMSGMPVQASQDAHNDPVSNLTLEEGLPGTVSTEDAEEEAALKEEAVRTAVSAAALQRNRTSHFDNESQRLRSAAGGDEAGEDPDDMDLLHPSTMPTTSSVQQPKMFQGVLKEYQLKGLQWLVNCYEQGLNGILADEMGLGKTIQAMAFLGHLAEEKNIWGPFLVVAPASVLNNWADEVNRFCPDLRILPYWGALNERTVLRKNINPNRLYRREAGFHVLITSYQLLVSDEKYFRRVKWQYMVLDEAQAIKSASSIRWKTLLSFNCRNRLLLTGTPIQNSMAELWALLHFIMPTLFDSHEQFNEWFSKGIEGHAEHGGTLNEHQLTRLHSILKPFMLRRVKKDVITEMTNKKEVMVPCYLSSRQQAFYRAIKNKISVADLFGNGGQLNDKKVLNLMNIVIQLRKVCNHPELFERNEGQSSVHFATVAHSLPPPPFGELEDVHYAGACNPVLYKVPKLLFRDGMRCLPTERSGSAQGLYEKWVKSCLSVFSPENVHSSSVGLRNRSRANERSSCSGLFGFIRMLDLSAAETSFVARASILERCLFALVRSQEPPSMECYGELSKVITVEQQKKDIRGNGSSGGEHSNSYLELLDDQDSWDARSTCVRRMLMLPSRANSRALRAKRLSGLEWQPFESLVVSHQDRLLSTVGLLRSVRKYMPAVRAPQISVICSDRGFVSQRIEELEDPRAKRFLVGFARTSESNGPAMPAPLSSPTEESQVRARLLEPLLGIPFRIFGSAPPLQSFDFAKMLTDSGKLQVLDILLKRLRAGNHRVLLFAQMTKMLNILEDYMNYRKFKYLRLDGSSTIMDRRDMVKDFQHRSDIFVFLLSTRAGGLGINLTAADTVIFYESDWNPTMDLQAMDRAHRLGQTKEVRHRGFIDLIGANLTVFYLMLLTDRFRCQFCYNFIIMEANASSCFYHLEYIRFCHTCWWFVRLCVWRVGAGNGVQVNMQRHSRREDNATGKPKEHCAAIGDDREYCYAR